MEYRQFGKLDWKGSVLGFGAMRLPVIDGQVSKVDEAATGQMVRYAVDHGVNYIDTAFPYHGGQSERCIGRILKDGYRERVRLATKMPSWLIESAGDFDRYLDKQLERLQTDRLDFYLLHALNRNFWPRLQKLGVLEWAERAMADGRFGRLGFSFHDDFSTFKEILDAYDDWALCQIQYNYMDIDFQAGTEGLRYAAGKGMAVVIMEPLRGGRLTKKLPPSVAEILAKSPQTRSMAEWALQWVWDHSEVSVVLSGMSSLEHVVENVACAERSFVNSLSEDEQRLILQVREAYREVAPIPCTNCQYCQPCPNGVAIPQIFDLYNEALMYSDLWAPRFVYQGNNSLKAEQRGDQCIECGLCEDLCPQEIGIQEWLKKAHELLGSN
ncbi:MAG: aldo/keto reductase [Syntrophales bacterium]|nr:aldo/keto reductase [Syntrophales bacterium]